MSKVETEDEVSSQKDARVKIWISGEAKRSAEKLKGNRSFEQFFDDVLIGYEKYQDLMNRFSELEAKYEELKESKIVEKWNFQNDKFKDLSCSLCGKNLLGKQVFAQKYEDGSKSYFCPECHYEGISDKDLYALDKKKYDERRLVEQARKEKERLYDEVNDLQRELKDLRVLDNLFEAFCREHKELKESELKPLLLEAIPILRDLKDMAIEKYLKEWKVPLNGGNPQKPIKQLLTKKCETCGRPFNPINQNHKYCSDECRRERSYGTPRVYFPNERPAGYDPFRQLK